MLPWPGGSGLRSRALSRVASTPTSAMPWIFRLGGFGGRGSQCETHPQPPTSTDGCPACPSVRKHAPPRWGVMRLVRRDTRSGIRFRNGDGWVAAHLDRAPAMRPFPSLTACARMHRQVVVVDFIPEADNSSTGVPMLVPYSVPQLTALCSLVAHVVCVCVPSRRAKICDRSAAPLAMASGCLPVLAVIRESMRQGPQGQAFLPPTATP